MPPMPPLLRLALLLSIPHVAEAAPAASDDGLEEIVVYGRADQKIGSAHSASEGFVGYDDLRLPPLLRVGELTEAVPGMVATQHSGTGKANQYFLRGFNLDHGTDFSAHLDGVPLNMRSHGHGQGYLDLNPMIPELVESTTYRKGTAHARDGDFASAGAVDFRYRGRVSGAVLQASLGRFGYGRGLAMGSIESSAGVTTAAVDVTRYDGPWKLDEDLEQTKLRLSHTRDLLGGRVHIALSGYDSRWTSTDQIPRRAVAAGLIDARGFLDEDLGGRSERWALDARLEREHWRIGAYHVVQDFSLWSNFTYFLTNPVDGDEFEQRDERSLSGLWLEGERTMQFADREAHWSGGISLRDDDIDAVGLYPSVGRVRIGTLRDDAVEEQSLSGWGELELHVTDATRIVAGLRGDAFDWRVDARLPENSGSGDDLRWSPKFALAHRFADGLEGYANWGRGFHSNDVRGATITIDPASGAATDAVPAIVASEGWELGLRLERGRRFNATLVLFHLELDSELVYVGDAGTTEPNDATERLGLELAGFWRLTERLAANLAWTMTDAEFEQDQGGGREIPGAVADTFTLGLNWAHPTGWFASSRVRWLGEAPLVEDDSVRSRDSLLVNAGAGWRRGALELRLDAFNLLDSGNDDIAFHLE